MAVLEQTRPRVTDDTELGALLVRASRGDLGAFTDFYDATCDLAWQLAVRRWHRSTAAGEAMYQRYLTAWLRAGEHAGSGLSPRAWLLSLPSASTGPGDDR